MKKHQQILFYINSIPPDYGGGYLRAFKMAARFKDKNLLTGIITLTKKKQFIKTENTISIDDILFLKTKLFIIIELFVFLYSKRKSFDVIYVVSSHWHTFFAVLICKILNKKVFIGITLSGVDSPAIRSKNIFINIYYKFKNLQFKLADKIMVNSPLVFDECIEVGYNKNKIEFIPNPVDVERFKPLNFNEKYTLKKQLGYSLDEKIILFVGILNKRKGTHLLTEICSKLNSFKIDYKLIIIGNQDSIESQKIIADINKFNKESKNKIIVKKPLNNIEDFYKISDLFLFPSFNEGLPNVIIEAMSCGLPVICSRLVGITDYLLDDNSLVEVGNTVDFSEKAFKILSDSEKNELQILKNRNFVVNNLEQIKIDSLFLNLIKQLK